MAQLAQKWLAMSAKPTPKQIDTAFHNAYKKVKELTRYPNRTALLPVQD